MARSEGEDVVPAIEWRGAFESGEVEALHAECFGPSKQSCDWWMRTNKHSLGWVCMRESDKLIGFANVSWDGGVHAFLLDVIVANAFQRRGLATLMVREVVIQSRAAGCEWLHVDFEPHLSGFYLESCDFARTSAGIMAL